MYFKKNKTFILYTVYCFCFVLFYFLPYNCFFRDLPCLTRGVATTGVTGAAHAVLQPGAVGEGVSLMWRPSRRQTLLKANTDMHIRRSQFKRDCLLFSYNWRQHSPCLCHSPLWPLCHFPPRHWLSCSHWRRSGTDPVSQEWMGLCHQDKN